jgi:hypothetical protein
MVVVITEVIVLFEGKSCDPLAGIVTVHTDVIVSTVGPPEAVVVGW